MACNCESYQRLLLNFPETLYLYDNDDLYCSLPVLTTNIDNSSFVECALLSLSTNSVATSWIQQFDLLAGNNFAQGVVNPLIQSTNLVAMPLGKYRLLLRVTTGGITQTFKTAKIFVLESLV
jgi:hypothetical protein